MLLDRAAYNVRSCYFRTVDTIRRYRVCIAVALATGACGDAGGVSGTLRGTSSGPIEVDSSLLALPSVRRCEPTRPGERLLGVSSEGTLWLGSAVSGEPGASLVRTIDPVTMAVGEFETPFASFGAVVVHGPTRASVIADGGLWIIGEDSQVLVAAPFSPGADAQLCGRLDVDAFVLNGTELFQRDGEEWIRWEGLDDVLSASGTQLLRRDGACWASEDGVALRGPDRDLWLLTPSALQNFEPREGTVALVDGNPATVDGTRFAMGGQTYELGAVGTPDGFAAAGSYAWLRFGTQVVRFDGEDFLRLEPPADGALVPFAAGGLWLVGGDEVCVADPGLVRVAGLVPQERRIDGDYALSVLLDGPASELVVSANGQTLSPTSPDGNTVVFEGRLPSGWSHFLIRMTKTASTATVFRRFQVKRIPGVVRSWQADIRPAYEAHCANDACHVANSASGAPDLSRFEEWVSRADEIEQRVVRAGDMPPEASRNGTWSTEVVETIRQWLDGGLRP